MDQCNHFRFVSIIARRFSTMSGMLFCAALMMGAPSLEASPYDVEITPDMLAEKPVYSPYAGRNYPDQVLFGDTHFHTNLSFDAGLIGTRLTAHEGFRFARGEQVISNTGQPVQLIRPLDFLVITVNPSICHLNTTPLSSLAGPIRRLIPLISAPNSAILFLCLARFILWNPMPNQKKAYISYDGLVANNLVPSPPRVQPFLLAKFVTPYPKSVQGARIVKPDSGFDVKS